MYLIPVIIKMPNSLFSPIFPHFTLNLYPSAKLFVSWLTANPRADTQYSNCSKSLKQPKSVYEAMIIRWNLLPLPVRWLQIIVLLGRYHYWSLVSPPFFWQDVTWSLCVFPRLQSQRLRGALSSGGALRLNQELPLKEISIIPEHYGWLPSGNRLRNGKQT